jgi:hypothetical protein
MVALLEARQATRLTGTLDTLQERQLVMWGRVAFEAGFGLAWDGATRTVEYDLEPNCVYTGQRCSAVEASIKDLLGREWLVTVKLRDVKVFVGTREDILRPDPNDAQKLIKRPFQPPVPGAEALVPPRREVKPGG